MTYIDTDVRRILQLGPRILSHEYNEIGLQWDRHTLVFKRTRSALRPPPPITVKLNGVSYHVTHETWDVIDAYCKQASTLDQLAQDLARVERVRKLERVLTEGKLEFFEPYE